MYRPLHQIKEEDQRVLERIYEGSGSGESSSSNNNSGSSDDNDDLSTSSTQKEQQPKKKPLTLEQQALQQRLKSAWKIAMQKGDEGALEKIQKAMEDLEKELIIVEEEEDTSTLDVIQRAMRERDERRVDDERDGEEGEMVGLISDLEEATFNLEIEDEEDGRDEAE